MPLLAGGPRRGLGRLLLPWLGVAALGCGSADERPVVAEAAALVDGPIRWLMLPEEQRAARQLRTPREAGDFLDAFWRRRAAPGNRTGEMARQFYDRVEAADRLYGDEQTRGSLSDRGRALILLGPPPVLRYGQKRVPSWEPTRPGSQHSVHTRPLAVETWIYHPADLPPALLELLSEEARAQGVTLVFLVESRGGTHLVSGEHFLGLAARAGVRP
jgi:GWxTD domain-containing protein